MIFHTSFSFPDMSKDWNGVCELEHQQLSLTYILGTTCKCLLLGEVK